MNFFKKLSVCLPIILLIITSCSDELLPQITELQENGLKEFMQNNEKALLALSQEDLNLYPMDVHKAVYDKLDQKKRYKLWKDKLSNKANLTSLDTKQRRFVDELVSSLDYYINHADEKDLEVLEKRAVEVGFSEEMKWKLFANLYNMQTINRSDFKDIVYVTQRVEQDDCAFRWCVGCGISDGNPAPPNTEAECIEGGCTETPRGCGWLWRQSCTKRCEVTIVWR